VLATTIHGCYDPGAMIVDAGYGLCGRLTMTDTSISHYRGLE
jgi:hypothetical protein